MNQYKLQLAVSAYRRQLRAIVALRRAEQTLANATTEMHTTREFFLDAPNVPQMSEKLERDLHEFAFPGSTVDIRHTASGSGW